MRKIIIYKFKTPGNKYAGFIRVCLNQKELNNLIGCKILDEEVRRLRPYSKKATWGNASYHYFYKDTHVRERDNKGKILHLFNQKAAIINNMLNDLSENNCKIDDVLEEKELPSHTIFYSYNTEKNIL